MTKQTRRRFFYLLTAAFLLLIPLIILYSLGYMIDFSKIRIEKTGGIFIKSKNHGVAVFLDGSFVKETPLLTNGTILTNIRPRTHLIRLEKSGFNPWFKTIEVKPMSVTELRNVLLVPNPVTTATSSAEEIGLISQDMSALPPRLKIDSKGQLVEEDDGEIKIIASYVNSFGTANNIIYWIDKNGFLARLKPDTKTVENIGRPGFYINKKPIRFLASPQGILFFIDYSGGLFILEEENKISPIDGGVVDIKFDGKDEKMIIQKEKSIEVLWLKDESYQPFRKKGTKETILALSGEIKDAEWFYGDNAHIAIRTSEGIFLTEVDGRRDRNTVELISGKTNELAATPEIPNAIFFRKDKLWFKIEL